MKYYKYKATYYNSAEDKECTDEGLVCAETYGKAADRVVEDYGIDDIIDIYLYEIYTDGECISKEEIKYAFKE